jgi:hypothetical protein
MKTKQIESSGRRRRRRGGRAAKKVNRVNKNSYFVMDVRMNTRVIPQADGAGPKPAELAHRVRDPHHPRYMSLISAHQKHFRR